LIISLDLGWNLYNKLCSFCNCEHCIFDYKYRRIDRYNCR